MVWGNGGGVFLERSTGSSIDCGPVWMDAFNEVPGLGDFEVCFWGRESSMGLAEERLGSMGRGGFFGHLFGAYYFTIDFRFNYF